MQRDMLDAAIKYAVQQDIVLSDWSEFRDYLVKESRGCLEAAELDVEKLFVYESYFKHNNAKNAKNAKKQEQFRHPDTPPKSPKNELQAVVCNSAAEQSLDLEETLPFSPALDTLVSMRSVDQVVASAHKKVENQRLQARKPINIRPTREHLGWNWLGLLYTR